MQNRYVADIGDFGKYALLRHIARTGLVLGINWYLVPNESHNKDGKHISYLETCKYKGYDDELLQVLTGVISRDIRNVLSIENGGLFPSNTCFYHAELSYCNQNMKTATVRTEHRAAWHHAALEKLKYCDIVFLDPDNGLQVDSVSITSQKGNKYIGYDELVDYYNLGKSIVFYNHRERKQEHVYLDKFRALKTNPAFYNAELYGLKFLRGTIRDFIFVLRHEHVSRIIAVCEEFLKSYWNTEFIKLDL